MDKIEKASFGVMKKNKLILKKVSAAPQTVEFHFKATKKQVGQLL